MQKRHVTAFLVCSAFFAFSSGPARVAGQTKAPPPPPKNPPPADWIDPRNPPKEDPNYKPPVTAWGHPDLGGRWGQISDIITYSIEDPEAERAGHTAISGQRPMIGRPIIDPIDGKIPYQPWAMEFAKVLLAHHVKPEKPEWLDPVSRGFQEGLPRINYQGAFEIIQQKDQIVFSYDYAHSWRVVPIDGRPKLPSNVKLWMGSSRGRWEGSTLIVDVDNLNDQTFIQIVGGFHSDAFRVEEHWTRVAPTHMVYIATVTDPKVYTQPMTIRVDMRKQMDDEQWENAVWEGNKLGGMSPEFWGGAKQEQK